jgi:FKBP-type peptidyl-prolyl cis-trans isomerase FkpA
MRSAFASVLLFSAAALATLPACNAKTAAATATAAAPTTEEDKTLYALGVLISKNLEPFQLTPKELATVQQGLGDGVNNKATGVDIEKYGPQVQELHRKRLAVLSAKEGEAGKAFLTKAAAEKGATKTASGIIITELKPGTGAAPKATDEVKVNYEGKLIDGKIFDSSIQRGEPATFPLNGVIPCWTEALQTMKVGGKARVVCPSDLAYGAQGSPPTIRPGATLVFEVELLDIVTAKK